MAANSDPNKRFTEFGPGETVMSEGSFGEGLYILMSGRLEVTVKGVKVAEIAERGTYVGEIASLLHCPRIATIKALTACTFLVVGSVSRYFQENPSAALGIAQTLAARIMEMNGKIVGYQQEISRWVERGASALESRDPAAFASMLEEMQKALHHVAARKGDGQGA